MRPGKAECRERWLLVKEIYCKLTGDILPEEMPRREYRKLDGVFRRPDNLHFIFELDEKQHFNKFRSETLELYPADLPVAFFVELWIKRCNRKSSLEGGGFAKPKPPLFPGKNGRHRQRAFRDALADIVPLQYGFLPTLRLGDFEVRDWIFESDAHDRMKDLIAGRFAGFQPSN